MKCIDSSLGELFPKYQLDRLSEGEKRRFEAHVLQCDYCFQQVYALGPAFARIKENPQMFMQALTEAEPEGLWGKFKAGFVGIPVGARWLAAAVVAVLAVLLVQPFRGPKSLADLAQVEPYPFHVLAPMGAEGKTEVETVFFQGMQSYNAGNYQAALPHLNEAVLGDPTDAEFQFFLGITHLLAGDAASALAPLQAAISLDPTRFEARARWYLGNAYLLLLDAESAEVELSSVVALNREYAAQSKELLEHLEAFMKN